MKQHIAAFLVCVIGFSVPAFAHASEISIRPFLFDVTLEPRMSEVKEVLIESDYTTRRAVLFATVNEITVDTEGEIKEFVSPMMTDRTNTVTSWIEVSRGRIEVEPQGSTTIPIKVNVPPIVEPGVYHAFVGFVEAKNRPLAEAAALRGDARGVVVKVEIADQRADSMKISNFFVERFVTGEGSREIEVTVENTGDLPSAPMGEIIFYDSRGAEVNSVPVNASGQTVGPGETIVLNSEIPLDDSLGRYKANISLQYGENQRASLYDTAFFYLMPMHLMLMLFGGLLGVSLLIALLFRRAFAHQYIDEDGDEVTLFIRDGHQPNPKDHDIDLSVK